LTSPKCPEIAPDPNGGSRACRTIVVAETSAEALTATNGTDGTGIIRPVDEVVAEVSLLKNRIAAELLVKLGISVSSRTVRR
jgi:hypothetical protein